MIYRLVYFSSAQSGCGQEELRQILETSRRNNARDGITGLLIHADGNFFQALEGEKDVVEKCFHRIADDERHGGIIIMSRGEADESAFPGWSMGYARPEDLAPEAGEALLSLQQVAERSHTQSLTADGKVALLVHSFLRGARLSHAAYGTQTP